VKIGEIPADLCWKDLWNRMSFELEWKSEFVRDADSLDNENELVCV